MGDGDSSCFAKVQEACDAKYGISYKLKKEECTGHVKKRMGAGLREFKRKKRGQKLSDGRGVGGGGRLTDAIIDRIQNNYGEAIRNNKDDNSMRTTINAVLHHVIMDNNLTLVQQHIHYPKTQRQLVQILAGQTSLCTYTESTRLPAVFKDEL